MSLLDITLPLSAEQTRSSVCWLTREDSPDPTEPFTSLHRTRFLPSWWGEMVSARSLSPGDDARQVKPPASSEPGLSGTFLRENYASSPTRTQAQLWTLTTPTELPVLGPANTSFLRGSSGSNPLRETPAHIWVYLPAQGESSLLSLHVCSAGSPNHPSAQRANPHTLKFDI